MLMLTTLLMFKIPTTECSCIKVFKVFRNLKTTSISDNLFVFQDMWVTVKYFTGVIQPAGAITALSGIFGVQLCIDELQEFSEAGTGAAVQGN